MNDVNKEFEKWRRDKFPALNDVKKDGINGWILIYGKRAWKQSRIKTLEKIQAKLKATVEYEWEETTEEYIDTELLRSE